MSGKSDREALLRNGGKPSSLTIAPRSSQSNQVTHLMQVQSSSETSLSDTKQLLKPRKPGWRVVLGKTAWSRHTYERPEGDELKLLGSVSKGAQLGAPGHEPRAGERARELGGEGLGDRVAAVADAARQRQEVRIVGQHRGQPHRIARGPEGSILATATERLHSRAANVPVRSKVGAGDSFVGGFSFGLARGDSLGVALQRGVSAASAAVMSEGTLLCRREDAERLFDACPSHPI